MDVIPAKAGIHMKHMDSCLRRNDKNTLKIRIIEIFILLVVFLLGTPLYAATPQEMFSGANDAYYKNRLELAGKFYNELIKDGFSSGHLHYNLGNIAYRQGRIGEAIRNYEVALRFIPRNTDLRANLRFVEKKRLDQFSGVPFWEKFLEAFFFWFSYLTLKESILIFAILSGVVWIIASLFLIFRQRYFKWGIGILIFVSVIFGLSVWFKCHIEKVEWAYVIKPEIEVHPTFLEDTKTLMKLHDGTKLKVLSRRGEWLQIQLPKRQKGWVRLENMGVI